jgi:hypothetical protein
MYVERDTEGRACNHCDSGQAKSITYSKFLSIDFFLIGAIPLCDSKINIIWTSIHNNIFDYK